MTERNQCGGCAIAATDSGYADAFYAIASAMGIGARSESPKHVFETEMLPRVRALVAGAAAPDEGESRDEIRRQAFEEAAKEPRAYAEMLDKGGWGNRFPDELCAIFNASTNMAERIRALSASKGEEERNG